MPVLAGEYWIFRTFTAPCEEPVFLDAFSSPGLVEECLERGILFGESSLRRALRGFVAHYRLQRNHQGIGNGLIEGTPSRGDGDLERRERFGGLLSYYERAA